MTGTAIPHDLARDLLEVLARRNAEIVRFEFDSPSTYLWARSPAVKNRGRFGPRALLALPPTARVKVGGD